MVIGRRFAWAHLPKTAGDATLAMFAAVPGLVQFADPVDSNDKHMPFFGREPEVAGKLLVMNIRRLPDWVFSGAQHKARHGVFPDYRPGAARVLGGDHQPDRRRRPAALDDRPRPVPGRALAAHRAPGTRTFWRCCDELGELQPATRAGPVTAWAGSTRATTRTSWPGGSRRAQLARLYQPQSRCGLTIERRVYGSLPID